jgi:hypothetical protein
MRARYSSLPQSTLQEIHRGQGRIDEKKNIWSEIRDTKAISHVVNRSLRNQNRVKVRVVFMCIIQESAVNLVDS